MAKETTSAEALSHIDEAKELIETATAHMDGIELGDMGLDMDSLGEASGEFDSARDAARIAALLTDAVRAYVAARLGEEGAHAARGAAPAPSDDLGAAEEAMDAAASELASAATALWPNDVPASAVAAGNVAAAGNASAASDAARDSAEALAALRGLVGGDGGDDGEPQPQPTRGGSGDAGAQASGSHDDEAVDSATSAAEGQGESRLVAISQPEVEDEGASADEEEDEEEGWKRRRRHLADAPDVVADAQDAEAELA